MSTASAYAAAKAKSLTADDLKSEVVDAAQQMVERVNRRGVKAQVQTLVDIYGEKEALQIIDSLVVARPDNTDEVDIEYT